MQSAGDVNLRKRTETTTTGNESGGGRTEENESAANPNGATFPLDEEQGFGILLRVGWFENVSFMPCCCKFGQASVLHRGG